MYYFRNDMKSLNRIAIYITFISFSIQCAYAQVIANITAVKGGNVSIVSGGYICSSDSVKFTNTSTGGPTYFEWTFQGGNITKFIGQNPPPIKFNLSISTTTTIKLKAANGADTNVRTFLLIVYKVPVAAYFISTLNQIAPATVTFKNVSTNANNLLPKWDFGDGVGTFNGDPATYTFNTPGIYPVKMVVNNFGVCFDSVTVDLNIENGAVVKMPNTFTPDDDNANTNELFRPIVNVGVKSMTCNIYDRWGNSIYAWEGIKGYWDGYTTGGQACVEGTYYYKLTAVTEDNKTINVQGYVQLVR